MIRTQTRRRILAVAFAAAMVPALSGCFAGFQATTNVQSTMNSGNGTQAQVGDIKIENATLVLGPDGSASATLLMRVVNIGTAPDAITAVQIGDQPAFMTASPVPLLPGASVSFGYESELFINAYGLEVEQSAYVPVTVTLQSAGTAGMQVLTVPPVGYYEGIAPIPPQAI